MIRLTITDGRFIYLAPEHITQVGSYGDKTYVTTVEHPDGPTGIVEDPFDIARLKAAWELRYHAPEIAGDLPVAVYMDRSDPENPSIQFLCCAITRKLRDQRAGTRPQNGTMAPVNFAGLFDEIFGAAFPNDPDKR
ncbi:hypothetical protein HOU00_gp070 [Caulobacter phage CcrPW]|uniref:Uncharacterized protein n=1 Tax=Caulobacter phage CcrPW TaxID=2283271 RepID=A0A385ED28_9CAUD|nr:hypothetical protein HOU00_gp070 [Caulobacter phage CcrPW]AXQ68609.1 hypothetical protein CcrPW_gp070 [Caulobacter phage CcrPW]